MFKVYKSSKNKSFFSKPVETIVEKVETVKNDNEPYFSIVGEKIDHQHGLIMQYDWNDAFIKYLKNAGYNGVDDDIIVEKWLRSVFYDIAKRTAEEF